MRAFYPQVVLLLGILAVSHGFLTSNTVGCHQLIFRKNAPAGVQQTRLPASSSSSAGDSSTTAPKARAPSAREASSVRLLVTMAVLPRQGSSTSWVERLESLPGYKQLPTRDRSLCRLLVTTTERRLGQIDKVLELCQKDTPKKNQRMGRIDLFVQAVLRVGAVQLLFVGVPPHAAVKETVDVLRMDPAIKVPESRIKFVNAVLRRLSREGKELLAKTDVTDNVADWFLQEWNESWGVDATRKIVENAMQETPRCLTIKVDAQQTVEQQIEQIQSIAGWFPDAEILPQGSVLVRKAPPGAISAWPLYQQGAWWLQDVSATLPALALYNGIIQREDAAVNELHVVDMCAAPGGKTAQLCNYGFASVTAVEKSAKRSKRLGQNKERLQMDWEIVIADGAEWIPPSDKVIAGILVDAPCTATGTGSKRPDVLRKDPVYQELLETQYKLACHAADAILQPGGILVYATCSLLKQESEVQVTKLLGRQDGAKLETIPFESGEMPGFDDSIDANGWLRVLPGSLPGSLKQCDGFFVARLRVVER